MHRKQNRDQRGRFAADNRAGPGRQHRLSEDELADFERQFRDAVADARRFVAQQGAEPRSIAHTLQLLPQVEGEYLVWLFERAMLARAVSIGRLKQAAERVGIDPDTVSQHAERLMRADFDDLKASGIDFEPPQSPPASATP